MVVADADTIHAERVGNGVEVSEVDEQVWGWLKPAGPDEEPHRHVSFTVGDRDATASEAERLSGTVLARRDTD